MDNLENERLLASLIVEFSDQFDSENDKQLTLDELTGSIEAISDSRSVTWLGKVPVSIVKQWDSLPLAVRVLVWKLCLGRRFDISVLRFIRVLYCSSAIYSMTSC